MTLKKLWFDITENQNYTTVLGFGQYAPLVPFLKAKEKKLLKREVTNTVWAKGYQQPELVTGQLESQTMLWQPVLHLQSQVLAREMT